MRQIYCISYVMPHEMTSSLLFNSIDGSLHIEGCRTTIQRSLDRDLAASALSNFYRMAIDHKNGYEWLAFQGVNFGGYPCGFSLGFHLGRLEEIHWNVALPNAEMESGEPTREAIDAEIVFVRKILSDTFARGFSSGQEHFDWGCVWCVFDAKGFQASSGLRYAA